MSNYVSMAPETPKISAWGALVKVITEPKATFEKLGDAPAVFPGYLLQMVAAGVALWFTLPLSLKMAEEMMAANPGMPAEAVAVGKWAGVIGGSIGALAGPWISGVLLALVAMFFGQFQGSPVKFPAYLGMIGYARVPLAINTIIGGLLASQAASLQDLATKSLSLAVFLPADASPHLRALLEAFNPFDLWYYVLMAIGFATLHKAKPAKAWGFAVTIFVLSLLVGLAGANAAKNLPTPGM